MQKQEDILFLFDIARQVKDFYETPILFVCKKDYSEAIFNILCGIREAIHNENKNQVMELIMDYHLQWLHAVTEIEHFKKSVERDLVSRTAMSDIVRFTMDALSNRIRIFHRFMDSNRHILRPDDQANLQHDLEIIEEMHTDVTQVLSEKMKSLKRNITESDYKKQVNEAIDQLLQWLDKINDGLSMKLSKYINVYVPQLTGDLTKTLQQIVDEMKTDKSESALKMLDDLRKKGSEIGSMIRVTVDRSLEMSKVYNKIVTLDDRIKRLEALDEDKPSAALLALKTKKEYFEQRLESLENLKTNLRSLMKITSVSVEDVAEEELCVCPDFFQLRIFNHCLPLENRERLVTELCSLWDKAVFGEGHDSDKSVISILSAAEVKEEFTDELGQFYVDEYSRKIYKLPDDDTLYQPNEHNQLVPVSDDADHVYYFDECGRYFFDSSRQRVYKAHATASEYMMDSTGVLLKVKEVREGVTYHYDSYGRYYINKDGKHIYRDPDATSEYENDGLGNLVRIRSHLDLLDPCPGDAHVTEDFRYLKETVGQALRQCIGQVLLHQPNDPIKYLSACLVNYRENIELRDRRARESEELKAERANMAEEERAAAEKAALEAALLMQGGSEASFDSNLVKYTTIDLDDNVSVGHSSN